MPLSTFEGLLKSLSAFPVIQPDLKSTDYVALDLSVDNPELKSVNVSNSEDLENFIWNFMSKHKAKAAFGGYLERRGIYNRSDYFNQNNPEEERNIHLGLDLWIEAEALVYAPLDGKIHSFNNNTNFGDYGPTIILKHHVNEYEFFTLYGHLSLESIADLKVGALVNRGEAFAALGTAEVNGDYPPHLHFQIIKDIQNYRGDYPGVSNALDLNFYKINCPDPNLLLNLV